MTSLEGWGSTIELRPRSDCALCRSVPGIDGEDDADWHDGDRRGLCRGSARRYKLPVLAGCGAAWLARLLWEQEAAGSNPAIPTENAGQRLAEKL